MSDEITNEEIKPEIEPVVAEKPVIIENTEPETVFPIQAEAPISTPQPVEALENTTIEPEITPKIEVAPEIGKIEQVEPVEPISVEIPVDPKIEENTSVLNEIPKEVVKQEEIPKEVVNTPINQVSTEIKPNPTPQKLPLSPTLSEEKPPAPEIQETTKTEPAVKQAPPTPLTQTPTPIITPKKISMRELFIKAQKAIQTRRRKKLNRVMAMFLVQKKITNDQVEKLLHISDSTATRYLAILKKEGKIKQNGITGKWVYYSKI